MSTSKSGTDDLIAQIKASGLHTQTGLRILRTAVKSASKNKRVPKGLRKNLKGLLPAIADAEKRAAKKRRKRDSKKARKALKKQLLSGVKAGSVKAAKGGTKKAAKGGTKVAKRSVKASPPVLAATAAEKTVVAGHRARKRARRRGH